MIKDNFITNNSIKIFSKYFNNYNSSFHIPQPSEWATENRIIPIGGSPYPGKVDMSILPHHIEIMDCCHPDNDIKRVSILKSVQAGLTTSMESVLGWAIRYKLHNILMLISSKNIAKIRGSAAIDTLIDNSGLAQYVKPMSNRTDRKSGDSVLTKEFGTHRLMITSYNSIADLKSLSWDLILLDELVEAPKGDFKGQGDVESIIHGRVKAMRNAKIFKYSTPGNAADCRITKNFLEADQRYYNVPCPLCGELQIMRLKAEGRDFGLSAKYEETATGQNVVVEDSIEYICEHCKKPFLEYQKPEIMLKGKWIPTAKAIDSRFRSYHVSGLMSPIMFYPWRDILSEFAAADFGKNIIRFRSFVNNALGESWENRTKKKSWEFLRDKKMKHIEMGTVPPGGFVITGGVDVQKDRLELQLVAWGRGMESFSFEHKIFYGSTDNVENESWLALSEYVTQTFKINEAEMYISRIAIDTGHNPGQYRTKDWGSKAHVVYNFVNLNPLFIAIKGSSKKEDILLRERRVHDSVKSRIDVNVDLIKEDITMKLDINEGAGAMHFVNYPDEFFKQFLSETYAEISKEVWGWKKLYQRNETWDTFIYARAAAEYMGISSWTNAAWDEYEAETFRIDE